MINVWHKSNKKLFYWSFRVSARPLWLVGPDVPSAGRANYRHALIIPTCFNPRSDKPYQNNHQFWQYTVLLRLQRLTNSQKACRAYYGICISHSGSTTALKACRWGSTVQLPKVLVFFIIMGMCEKHHCRNCDLYPYDCNVNNKC